MGNPIKEYLGHVSEVASDAGSYLKGGHQRALDDFSPVFLPAGMLFIFVMMVLSPAGPTTIAVTGLFLALSVVYYLSYVLRGPRCTSTGT